MLRAAEPGHLRPIGIHEEDLADVVPSVIPRVAEHRQVL
jgi:hypothetical protein